MLRTGRKGLAAATLIGDMLKGTVAVIIAGYTAALDAAMPAALGAFLGHLFPVWLKLQRRQRRRHLYRRADRPVVAGRPGVLHRLDGHRRDLALLVAGGFGREFRHADFAVGFGHLALAALFAVLTLLLFYMHRENIKRLLAGTEGKIGQK